MSAHHYSRDFSYCDSGMIPWLLVLERIEAEYGPQGTVTKIDGLSVEFDDWRFNLRRSNTEPVIRLNVEARQDEALMQVKTEELLKKIRG